MYSTAALMLANGHIQDLYADADRERRALLAHHLVNPRRRRASMAFLRSRTRGVVRHFPWRSRATAT
jgi:hypothetical protein